MHTLILDNVVSEGKRFWHYTPCSLNQLPHLHSISRDKTFALAYIILKIMWIPGKNSPHIRLLATQIVIRLIVIDYSQGCLLFSPRKPGRPTVLMGRLKFLARRVIEDGSYRYVLKSVFTRHFHTLTILLCNQGNNDTAVCLLSGYVCDLGEPETLFKPPNGGSVCMDAVPNGPCVSPRGFLNTRGESGEAGARQLTTVLMAEGV